MNAREMKLALEEQTSRANHHEERATQYQALLRECDTLFATNYHDTSNSRVLRDAIRAALGEVQP